MRGPVNGLIMVHVMSEHGIFCCCRVPSLKRSRDADASLAEGHEPKRSRPAVEGIQGSNSSSTQGSPRAHATANGSAMLQADNELPQPTADPSEADGGSEHRSHRKHRHKHHRKDREASEQPLGVSHRQEKRHSSSSHKVWLAAFFHASIKMPLITPCPPEPMFLHFCTGSSSTTIDPDISTIQAARSLLRN